MKKKGPGFAWTNLAIFLLFWSGVELIFTGGGVGGKIMGTCRLMLIFPHSMRVKFDVIESPRIIELTGVWIGFIPIKINQFGRMRMRPLFFCKIYFS